MANKTYKVLLEKLGGTTSNNYIGNEGELFFDPTSTTLRLADGTTPGGTVINIGGGSGDTGDVTFDGVSVIGGGTASGDGNGYGTLQLVPDENLIDNDQYLIIDPTEPLHIHIRAGGTQDDSQADLFLGAELSHVRVRDSSGVRLQNYRNVENNYYYNSGFTSATWFTEGSNHFVEFTTTNSEIIDYFYQLNNNENNGLRVYYDGGESSFALEVVGTSSGGDVYTAQVSSAPPASPTTVSALDFILNTVRENEVILENNDFTVRATDDLRMYSSDVFALYNYSDEEPISIYTNYDGDPHQWQFREDGIMSYPDGSLQTGGAISKEELKILVAASTDFADFQSRIAAL